VKAKMKRNKDGTIDRRFKGADEAITREAKEKYRL